MYRGRITPRRLVVLIRHLPLESALVRALNGGNPELTLTDHLLADVWVVTAKANSKEPKKVKDHPLRAKMLERKRVEAKQARLAQIKADYEQRKRRYIKEVTQ